MDRARCTLFAVNCSSDVEDGLLTVPSSDNILQNEINATNGETNVYHDWLLTAPSPDINSDNEFINALNQSDPIHLTSSDSESDTSSLLQLNGSYTSNDEYEDLNESFYLSDSVS